MATTLTVSSNYAGSAAGEIIGKSFQEAKTIANNWVTVAPDIDYQQSIRKISYSNGRVDYSCGFTPAGAVTLSERTLVPKKIKNELEICKEDLRQIWSAATMGFSAHNDSAPQDVEAALLNEILMDQAVAVDTDIWVGPASTTGRFEGFVTKWDADAAVVKVGNGLTALAADITKANVLSELEKVTAAQPVALRQAGRSVLMVSSNVFLAYMHLLGSSQITNGLGGDELSLKYGKFELVENAVLADNTIIMYDPKNLYFGTGLLADHNEVRIKDMDESELSGNIRYKTVYTGGVQYANSEDIVWYVSN